MPLGSRKTQLKIYQWIRLFTFLGTIGMSLLILLKVENMLLSALLAFVIAYLLGPVVDAMERAGLSRLIAIIILFVVLSIGFLVSVSAIIPFVSRQFVSLQAELPKYIAGTTNLIQDIEANLDVASGAMLSFNLSQQVEDMMISWTTSLFEDIPSIVSRSLTVILLAPFLAFFLLKDGQSISRALLRLVPNNIFELILNLHHQINDQMGHFIRARLAEAGIIGVVVWVGLASIGFPYASLLAMFAALTNLIPYIGPFIGVIPALIIALINGYDTLNLLLMGGIYLIAQIIDVVFIIPLVVAKIVDLHPVTVVVALLIGAQLMGVVGMLVSIPVASMMKVTFVSLYQHLVQFRA